MVLARDYSIIGWDGWTVDCIGGGDGDLQRRADICCMDGLEGRRSEWGTMMGMVPAAVAIAMAVVIYRW